MKYFRNLDVVLFGTSSGSFGEKIVSVVQSVFILQPFENYPVFWPKSTQKRSIFATKFINHVKKSKCSAAAKIISHL